MTSVFQYHKVTVIVNYWIKQLIKKTRNNSATKYLGVFVREREEIGDENVEVVIPL